MLEGRAGRLDKGLGGVIASVLSCDEYDTQRGLLGGHAFFTRTSGVHA